MKTSLLIKGLLEEILILLRITYLTIKNRALFILGKTKE